MRNFRRGGGSERLEAVSEPLFNFAANRSAPAGDPVTRSHPNARANGAVLSLFELRGPMGALNMCR